MNNDWSAEFGKNLGDPFFADDTFVLYNMDCVEFMQRVEGSPINLTVTSPPYNIGKAYEKSRALHDYLEWCKTWMAAISDITSEVGSFWLNIGYTPLHPDGKAVPLAYLLWDKTALYFMQEIVWNYGAGVAARKSYSPRNEKFLWYVKDQERYTFNLDAVRDPNVKYPKQYKNGVLKVNPLGKNPSDVWQFAKVTSGANRSSVERTPHPAQFPEEVIDRIIKASSNAGDLVFDPFMGSGTTAVCAQTNGRRVVGTEIDSNYCQLTVDRYLRQRRASEQLLTLDIEFDEL